jgi:radical SAM protein with 4Fe4S-binding SPASM domain
MRKDLPEMVRRLNDLGIPPMLATKGHVTAEIAGRLAAAGMKRMQVSIDAASPGVADLLTGSTGYFHDAIDSIRNIRAEGIFVRTNCIMTRLNVRLAPKLIALLQDLGVTSISLTGFGRSAYIDNDLNDALFIGDDDRDFLNELPGKFPKVDLKISAPSDRGATSPEERAKVFGSRSSCSAGFWGLIAHADGKVTLCDEMPVSDFHVVGSLRTHSIMEVWNSPRMDDLLFPERDLFRDTACSTCREFVECHTVTGRCFRDAMKAFGSYWAPSPNCPSAPAGLRQT